MKYGKFILAAAAVLFSACQDNLEDSAQQALEVKSSAVEKESPFLPGTTIVELSEETAGILGDGSSSATKAGISVFSTVVGEIGNVTYERVYPDAGEFEPRHREAGLHRWYYVRYDSNVPADKAAESLVKVGGVISAEPVRKVYNTGYFNDPRLGDQWHYFNDGSRSGWSEGCDINVVPVWDRFTCGDPSVIVAVEDQGVQLDHPDLVASTIPGGDEGSHNFVSNYAGPHIFAGDHGTHVAGTIAATNNNGIGVCGIAGGSDGKGGVRVMSCQVFMKDPADPDKSLQGNFMQAMVWSADHGAVISQNSWGNVYESAADAKAGSVGAMKSSIDYFIKYAGTDLNGNQTGPMKGGVVFFSAGNDNWPDGWPAEYSAEQPKCISVGALGASFRKASYSNYGDWVTICAPGGDNGCPVLSSIVDGYGTMQGTSMACPHVSGVAALLVSYFGGPGFTNDMLVERLLKGANQDATLYQGIGPMLDALGSFSYGGTLPPDKVASFEVNPVSNNLQFDFQVTSDPDDGKAYSYLALASKDVTDLESLDLKNIPSSVKTAIVQVGDLNVGDDLSVTISGLEFDTEYHVALAGVDYSQNYSDLSEIKKVRTMGNNAPEVKVIGYDGDYVVRAHETLTVRYEVSDPDGHSFTVETEDGSAAASLLKGSKPYEYNLVIVGRGAPAGKYTAHLIATDSYGATNDFRIDYEIMANHPPQLVKDLEDIQFDNLGSVSEINMDEHISDPDGEPLKYEISTSGQNVVHLNPDGNTLYMTALGYGLVDVSVKASDTCGETVEFKFKALVRDASRPVDVYPNPVYKDVNIRIGKEESAEVKIVSDSGTVVYKNTGVISPFSPMKVDMSGCAAGAYTVVVKSASVDASCKIIKL